MYVIFGKGDQDALLYKMLQFLMDFLLAYPTSNTIPILFNCMSLLLQLGTNLSLGMYISRIAWGHMLVHNDVSGLQCLKVHLLFLGNSV